MEYKSLLRKKGKQLVTGDVFEVPLGENEKGYFQFLYKDDSYMGGHVIRGFTYRASLEEEPSPETIVGQSVMFHTLTRVFEGWSEGLWRKIGKVALEPNFEPPTFRQQVLDRKTLKVSKWVIWKGDFDNWIEIGEMTDEYRHLDYSSIVPPFHVVKWLKTGKFGIKIED